VRVVGVDIGGKTEARWEVSAHLLPRVAAVVTPHDVPVLLHEEHVGPRRVHRDAVDAVPNLALLVRELARPQAAVDRAPRLAAVVRAENARRRDGDDHPLWVIRVDENRVQAQSTGARLPLLACRVTSEPRQLLPGLPRVG